MFTFLVGLLCGTDLDVLEQTAAGDVEHRQGVGIGVVQDEAMSGLDGKIEVLAFSQLARRHMNS